MKRIIPILLLFFPHLLFGRFYGEVESGLQVNHPTASSVGAVFARLRIGADLNTFHSNVQFHLRMATASGKAYFGSTLLMAPANSVALDPKGLILDEAYFSFVKKYFELHLGLMDPAGFLPLHSGFFNQMLIGDQSCQFLSTHFLWLLANNGLDQFFSQSLPGLFLLFHLTEKLCFKTGMTFGLASQHLFLRNSMPAELEWTSKGLHLSLNAGFGDAHSSYTHKISPSWGIVLEKRILSHFYAFTKLSRVEKDIKTYRTPAKTFSSDYLVAMEFSSFQEHEAAGLVFNTEEMGMGMGLSQVKEFIQKTREKVIELFFRKKVLGGVDVTPDFQYIFHPNGNEETKFMWIAGMRILYRFDL